MNWIYYTIPQRIIKTSRPISTHDAIAQVAGQLGISKGRVSGYISALVRAGQLGITAPGTAKSTLI